jgi:DNA-binding SARP family transcriptional activator
MTRLVVRLLGDLQVGHGASGPAVPIPARKQRALLAYLALRPGRAHPRDRLTALLWPDVAEAQARQSLRQALAGLRRALCRTRALVADADTVAVDPARVDVDVARFEQLVSDGSRARLEQAVVLYRSDFLEGLQVKAPAFEDWLLSERERLRELAQKALAKLLANQTRSGSGEIAVHTARRLLALDPLQEDVHQALMRLYVAQGQRAAALRQYQSCVGILRRELGVEPEAATKRVYQEILQQPLLGGGTSKRPSPSAERHSLAGSQPGRAHGEVSLIGRDVEIAWLRRARDEAWRGCARLVLVTGEAGIGKTRVLEQLAVEAGACGGRVLAGRFHETEQILPFQAWIDALRSGDVLGGLGDLGTWRGELTRLFPELGPPPGTAGSPARLLEAMLAIVDALAARQRLLLVLDDLHWADEMSIRLLSFIGRRIGRRPVLILGSAREEDLTEARSLRHALEELDREQRLVRLALSPLSQVHTVQLVRTLLRRGTAETSVERVGEEIWRTSEGNPFVIVEALRELIEGGRAPGAGPVLLPRRVRDLLDARLERLGEPSRCLAAAAAVIGRDFSFALLQRSSGLGPRETAEALEELVRRRIMSAVGEGFDFTHERIRRVVYDELLEPRRRALHTAVGEALEVLHADRPAEIYDRLAHHYMQAGATEKAVTYLTQLGETARVRHALDDALRAFDRALDLVDHLPSPEAEQQRLNVLLRKSQTLSVLGRFRDILALLRPEADLVARLDQPALFGAYQFRLGLTYTYLGNQPRAEEAAARAMAAARRAGDETLMGQTYYVLALGAYWSGAPGEGVRCARRAIELLARAGNQNWLGLAHLTLGLNLQLQGALEEALQAHRQVEALGQMLADSRLLSLAAVGRGLAHAERAEWEAAFAAGQCALESSLDPVTKASTQALLGMVYLGQDEVEAAASCLETALADFERFGHLQPTGRFMSLLSEVWLRKGHLERAQDLGARALAISREAGSRWAVGVAERVLARVAFAEGCLSAAAQRLRDAIAIFEAIPIPSEVARTHLALAEVAQASGEQEEAATCLREAMTLFEAIGAPRCAARAVQLAARLGIAPDRPASPPGLAGTVS